MVAYYAAIHGNSPEDYLGYLNMVLSIENESGREYSGFAVGNLGNTQRPSIYKTVKLIRKRLNEIDDSRPIHVPGVGSIQNIIPLSLNGADTFDCHSPWRRASEDKLVRPLLNSDFEIVTRDRTYWSYVSIDRINALNCDCEVCKRTSISELKGLKDGTTEEKCYFRILAYKHNIHQQETLCELVRSEIDLQNFVRNLPDSKYKKEMHTFLVMEKQRTLP